MDIVVVQSPSHVQLFATPWTAARQPSLSFTISRSLPKFMSIALVMPSSQPSHPLMSSSFFPQSFPASGTFPMSQLFTSGDQIYRSFSFSIILPTSVQGWFPLRLTGLISLLSKGVSGVFSSTTVRRYQYAWMYLLLILFFWSALTDKIPINESGNCTSSSQSLFIVSTLNHFLSKMWIWWSGCFFMERHEF